MARTAIIYFVAFCFFTVMLSSNPACAQIGVNSDRIVSVTETRGDSCAYELRKVGSDLSLHVSDFCRPDSSSEISIIQTLLDKGRASNFDIKTTKYFILTNTSNADWNQKIIDCYLGSKLPKIRSNSSRLSQNGVPELINKCGSFDNLIQLFRRNGVNLTLVNIEKMGAFDLRKLKSENTADFDEVWVKSHLNLRGIVPLGGRFEFKVTPYVQ